MGSIRGLSGVGAAELHERVRHRPDRLRRLVDVRDRSRTSASWPTGVYLAKLVREDNNTESQILFVVRHDGGHADVLYRVPDTTYQAYNNYGGRSSYDWNSSGDPTVSGTSRAVKVSFNRPYKQVFTTQRDFYTFTDVEGVSWLEQQGYDVDYASTLDVENGQAVLTDHKVAVSGAHDEYVPQSVRNAMTNARNAGTSLAFLGANAVYWRVRFESQPRHGRREPHAGDLQDHAERHRPTRSARPAPGVIRPARTRRRTRCSASQYIGDNEGAWFPMKVSAAEGQNRFWRHTGFANLAPGTFDTLGQYLVGWEWDARVANGLEPAGVQTLSSTPVDGQPPDRRRPRLHAGLGDDELHGLQGRERRVRLGDRHEPLDARPRAQRARPGRAEQHRRADDDEHVRRHGRLPDDADQRPRRRSGGPAGHHGPHARRERDRRQPDDLRHGHPRPHARSVDGRRHEPHADGPRLDQRQRLGQLRRDVEDRSRWSPTSQLATGTVYTARLATTVKAWSGQGLAARRDVELHDGRRAAADGDRPEPGRGSDRDLDRDDRHGDVRSRAEPRDRHHGERHAHADPRLRRRGDRELQRRRTQTADAHADRAARVEHAVHRADLDGRDRH